MGNGNKDGQLLTTLGLLNKTLEQIDKLILGDKDARYTHWRNNIYTVIEDIEDKIEEDME